MKTAAFLVFDESIHGAGPHYTDVRFNEALGRPDKLALMGVTDDAAAAATLNVRIEHSADGRNWSERNGGSNDVAVPVANAATSSASGGDPTSHLPALPLARLKITPSVAISCHLKLFACGRDS